MENQKVINPLTKSNTNSRHFATKKWYVINDLNNTAYGVDQYDNNEPANIKYETKVLKPNLCDYSDAYILVTGIIQTVGGDANTKLALKNCAPCRKCILHVNDEYVEKADTLDVAMPMYNLIEYSDNYSDSSATLYQFKRDEPADDNDTFNAAGNGPDDFNSDSFKYKFNITGTRNEVQAQAGPPAPACSLSNTEAQAAIAGNVVAGRVTNNVNIVVPLKYLSNFFRSLEMPLINCKIHLELDWSKNCILSNLALPAPPALPVADNSKFIIRDTKLYIPVVTLSKEDNKDFIEQQSKGFQRSIYWKEYLIKESNEAAPVNNTYKTFNVDPSFQGVNRLFVMAFNSAANNATRNSYERYYLPRVGIKDCNAIIDGRSFYDNNINSDVEKYTELKKVMIGKGEDYNTGSLLDYDYFKKNYKLVAIDLSKQKELDAHPRAIQQIEFKCKFNDASIIYIILEKSKETILEFYKGAVKVY